MTEKKEHHSPDPVRCAVYTRKSTDEGLEQEFNSLDSQRESGDAFVASQRHEGWVCLPDHYDDGGFTGANMDRPALRRLLADIEDGKVDCVVVYKVDRISRSLLDFARIMEVFDKHNVSFVSVTQAFNTGTSMGRLILNVLLSFAQFEREMISERTRDKIAATRRKGKWSGGMPVLGYDVVDTKLVVNPDEADRVRTMFQLYLDRRSLTAVCRELDRRGWVTKCWTTKKDTRRGGMPFNKTRLHKLLTNVAYIGKVRYKDEVHDGEHESIVSAKMFAAVQQRLEHNGPTGGRGVRNKHGALLKGLVHCHHCDCAMAHSYTSKDKRRYRYYVCTNAQKRGWDECPSPSLPAGEIERFIVDQIRCIGRDPALLAATLAQTRRQSEEAEYRLTEEKNALRRQCRADEAELRRLAVAPAKNGELNRLAEIQERLGEAARRLSEIDDEMSRFTAKNVGEAEVAAALADFDAVWEALVPREQVRILELLVDRIEHDGERGNLSITFHPTSIKSLVAELAENEEAVA